VARLLAARKIGGPPTSLLGGVVNRRRMLNGSPENGLLPKDKRYWFARIPGTLASAITAVLPLVSAFGSTT
jgi:hypothetical protein